MREKNFIKISMDNSIIYFFMIQCLQRLINGETEDGK